MQETARSEFAKANEQGLRIGEDHPNARLSDHEVDLLLELHEAGYGYGRLARKFDISKSQARNICKGHQRSQVVRRWVAAPPRRFRPAVEGEFTPVHLSAS